MKTHFIILATIIFYSNLFAQPLPLKEPELSQASFIKQQIGLSIISVSYNSPLTNGRKVFGQLVPNNKVWRAGANENTVFSITDDVLIDGQLLKAGSYGLHIIPSENEWIIIFSTSTQAWGSYYYNEKQDALRITVKPDTMPLQNWLSYNFIKPEPKNVFLQLRWDAMAISFNIKIYNFEEVVIKSMQNELTSRYGFFWQGYAQAASYCLRNKVHLDDAEKWIDKSISLKKNYTNLSLKAALYKTLNKLDSADIIKKEAKKIQQNELYTASENEINIAAYNSLAAKDYEQALILFKLNVSKYPNSWNVYDGLAEALMLAGDKNEGIKNYKLALTKVLPEEERKRIQLIIKE